MYRDDYDPYEDVDLVFDQQQDLKSGEDFEHDDNYSSRTRIKPTQSDGLDLVFEDEQSTDLDLEFEEEPLDLSFEEEVTPEVGSKPRWSSGDYGEGAFSLNHEKVSEVAPEKNAQTVDNKKVETFGEMASRIFSGEELMGDRESFWDADKRIAQGMSGAGKGNTENALYDGLSTRETRDLIKGANPEMSEKEVDKKQQELAVNATKNAAKNTLSLLPVGRGVLKGAAIGTGVGAVNSILDSAEKAYQGKQDFFSKETARDAVEEGAVSGVLSGAFNTLPHAYKFAKGYTKGLGEVVEEGAKIKRTKEAAKTPREKDNTDQFVKSAINEVEELKKNDRFLRRVDNNPNKVTKQLREDGFDSIAQKIDGAAPLSSKLAAKADKASDNALPVSNSVKKNLFTIGKSLIKNGKDETSVKAKNSAIKFASDKLGLTRNASDHNTELAAARRFVKDEYTKEIIKEVPGLDKVAKLIDKGDFEKAQMELMRLTDKLDEMPRGSSRARQERALQGFMDEADDVIDFGSKSRSLGKIALDNSPQILAAYAEPALAAVKPLTQKYVSKRNSQFYKNIDKAISGDEKFIEGYKKVMRGENPTGPLGEAFFKLGRQGVYEKDFKKKKK